MKKIVLCSNSVVMSGLAASLQSVAGVEVTQSSDPLVALDPPGLGDSVDLPDMVVVDMTRWSAPLTRLCVQRKLLLVGVDVDHSKVMVLSAKSFPASSIQEVSKCLADLCRAPSHYTSTIL